MADVEDRHPKIVLCLMVANEEKIIERCLRSALPHVDGVVVCWNGTDATVDIAKRVLERHDSHFEEHKWVNFGHNRTLSAKAAKDWVRCKHPEWPLDSTYLLFMDADMELVVEPGFNRSMLIAPGYKLIQSNHGEDYRNLRLARLSHDWRSVGVTHEFWAATPDIGEPAVLDTQCDRRHAFMWLMDHDDGGSKSDKTERDIRLLEQGLIDEPGNGRYMFYLARAYADSGQHEKAIELYRKRRAVGGWDQEVWYAHYREGISLLALGKDAEGIGTLLQAYQERPTRAETLAHLAQHSRERGRNALALMFARQASKISKSNDDLFIWADAHQNLPLREIAIAAYYVPGAQEEGISAAETLLARRDTDRHTYQHMAQTLSFYLRPLGEHALRKGAFEVSPEIRKAPGLFYGLEAPNTTEYNCSNPTIVAHDGRTYVNVRLNNYYHERGRVFAPKDPDGVVRTRNVVVMGWWPDSGIDYGGGTHQHESIENLPAEWDHTTRVRGLEDQRWCSFEGRIWLTATCFNIPSAEGMPRVVLGRFDENVTRIEQVLELKYAGIGPYEKNWLPWNKGDGKFRVIYGYEPFTVLLVDTVTGDCTVESSIVPLWPCGSWRGSAAPVRSPAGDGLWLAMIHETAWFEGKETHEQRTVYMHRFIEFDDQELIRRSPLFVFDHTGVEYAAGMLVPGVFFPPTCAPTGATVIVTYSVEEAAAKWVEFSWELVNNMLDGKRP